VAASGPGTRVVAGHDVALSHGRHGSTARIERHEREGEAAVALSGCLDRVGLKRLERILDGLATRGVRHLVLDCARLRHVDYALVRPLALALGRFETRSGTIALQDVSVHLRDLFRLAGCEGPLRSAASAAALAAPSFGPGAGGERAS